MAESEKNWRRSSTRADGRRGITCYIDEDLFKELKVLCVRRDMSMQDMAEQALIEQFRRMTDDKTPIPGGGRETQAA